MLGDQELMDNGIELGGEVLSLCFFFQAEEGIRDLTVTGVQTCALPIYTGFEPSAILSPSEMADVSGARVHEIVRLEQVAEEVAVAGPGASGFADAFRARLREQIGRASCRERG